MVRQEAEVREGFFRLVDYSKKQGFRLAIVSNGLDFYIEEFFSYLGLNEMEIHAASTRFTDDGIDTFYEGPDGRVMMQGFKEAYARLFLDDGSKRLIYIGNGSSDYQAARLADYAFATGPLVDYCTERKMDCIPFESMDEIIAKLKELD
jgi:2-hydroxy-3-keto-5-methylthiopentenyl-1-phosphate phosphatase